MTGRWRLVRAGRAAIPESARRFAVRARRRRLRAALPWLSALGATALLAASAGLVTRTSVFGVARVRVVGATMVTPEEVVHAAAVPHGTPLARLDTAAVARRVERVPAVRAATVVRTWPKTLTITVVERTPVAVVPVAGGSEYLAIDEFGVAFQRLTERPPALALVRLTAAGPDDPATREALAVLAALPAQLRAQLAALSADAPARVRLELADGRIIVWGDASDNQTKARVALELMTRAGTVLDVSAPYVPTVR